MSIFFPDNDHRRNRLIELSSDTQSFLKDAKNAYEEFILLNTQVNAKIIAVYKQARLTPPLVSPIDILQAQKPIYNMQTGDTIVEISNILLGVGGLVATVSYFGPAATMMLVEVGVLEAETASAVLFSALGAEITVGAFAGGIVGGLVVGVLVVGIGLAIDAFEGYELRDELRKGIYQMDQLRALTKFALDKSKTLMDLLQSVKTTCDSLLASSIELTDAIITKLIQKNAISALKLIESITKDYVLSELKLLDQSRNSWTNEDSKDIFLPKQQPIYVNVSTEVPQNLCPSIPQGLKLTALESPNGLKIKDNYSILRVESVQYWPFSYVDNRDGMAIIAFDGDGNMIKRWDKVGARYVWKIDEDLATNNIVFIGQAERKIIVKWSELTDLSCNVGVTVPINLCPTIPTGLKLIALQNPYSLNVTDNYPILTIGNIQYWSFSYIDNRNEMAIIAFDKKGTMMRRWDKRGSRYIWKIEKKLDSQNILFIGQDLQTITIPYNDLVL
jgi:hypothetical protein